MKVVLFAKHHKATEYTSAATVKVSKLRKAVKAFCETKGLPVPVKDGKIYGVAYFSAGNFTIAAKKVGRFTN